MQFRRQGVFYSLPVVVGAAFGRPDGEGVEDVVVGGDEGACGGDVEVVAAENAAEVGKQAVGIGQVNHDLQHVAVGRMRADAGAGLFGMVNQMGGVPEDFAFLMVDEIRRAECLPQFALFFFADAGGGEGGDGGGLSAAGNGGAAVGVAVETAGGSLKEVFQQAGFP